MRGNALRLHGAEWLARLRQQVPHHEHRVAHHVIEHTSTLERALPEPRRVRAAVLLCGAGKVRTPCRRSAARPEQRAASLHLRREHLVFQVAVHEPHTLHQPQHLLRLGHIAREGFLAGYALEGAASAVQCVDDFLDVLHARLVGPGDPDGVDGRVSDHVANGRVRLRGANVEFVGIPRGIRCARGVRAPDAEDVCITNALPAEHVKAGVEATADEANAEPISVQGITGWGRSVSLAGRRIRPHANPCPTVSSGTRRTKGRLRRPFQSTFVSRGARS